MTLQELQQALDSADPEERRLAAARVIDCAPEGRAQLLMRALGDSDWRVRKEAVTAAVRLAPAPEVLKSLVQTLHPGENVGLRNAAVEALAGYGDRAVEALDAVLPTLDADGRKLAAEALGRSGLAAALGPLSTLIDDPDPNVQATAVESVAAVGLTCGEKAVPILHSCLSKDDRLLRLAAVSGLNQLGVVLPWSSIETLMSDPILERSALEAAGRSASAKAAPLLIATLESGQWSAARSAILALVDLIRGGGHTHETVRDTLRQLSETTTERLLDLGRGVSGEPDLQRAALIVIGMLGTRRAAEVAVGALADVTVAAEAEEALGQLGGAALEVLVERAKTEQEETRAACLELLGRLGGDATHAAIAVAVDAVGDPSPEVARAALTALARIGDARSVQIAAAQFAAEVPAPVRQAAAAALSTIARRHPDAARELARRALPDGPDAHAAAVITGALSAPVRDSLPEDVAFLSRALSAENTLVRRASAEALAEIASPLGLEAVVFALTDEDRSVQVAAVRALGRMRAEDGSSVGLGQLLVLVERSEDEALIVAAIRALGDAQDARSVGVLRNLARSGPPRRAVAAIEAVARLQDPRRVDALIDALGHPDAEVVKAALRALADEVDARVLPHLGACLDHEAWDVRRLAADLLGHSGGQAYVGTLRAKLAVEAEPLVKEAIQRALSELETASGVRRSPPPVRMGSWRPR